MHWLEYHWYRLTPLHMLLLPVSLLFSLLVSLRRVLYRLGILTRIKLPVPVVIVGNISVGGTGKTPLTLALAEQLLLHGMTPLIVSRGYGGSARQPLQVTIDCNASLVGDEPLLMARRLLCPVWIGKDRAAAATAALQIHPECNVLLCDDGLQHYRLQRDVEIAVIDGVRGMGNGWMLPAGPLREPVARLETVDAVVVNGGQAEAAQFSMQLQGEVFYNLLEPEKIVAAGYFKGLNTHAVAGIGRPERYFQQLQALEISFIAHAFADHHPYRATDFAFSFDALLLTEKDAVKCSTYADARFWVLRVDAQIDPALAELILRKITPDGCKTA